LRLNYAKYHVKYLSQLLSQEETIKIEEVTILSIHNEIINIITNNSYLIEYDIELENAIMNYINHAITYIYLKKFNLNKNPSNLGFGFPEEFENKINEKMKYYRQ
jgi:hypothetical protein